MDNLLIIIILILCFGGLFLHIEARNKKLKQSIKSDVNEIISDNNTNSSFTHVMTPNVRQPAYQESVIKLYSDRSPFDKTIIREQPNLQDAIIERDYRVINDPLSPVVKRPASYIFPPTEFTRYIDIPTRGYPDNYQYLGNMFRMSGNSEVSGDKVVKLFGRQKFPGSNQYEYYGITNDSSTLNYKIPISSKHDQEIFDGDTLNISSLGGTFKVNLHPDQTFRYNPYVL